MRRMHSPFSNPQQAHARLITCSAPSFCSLALLQVLLQGQQGVRDGVVLLPRRDVLPQRAARHGHVLPQRQLHAVRQRQGTCVQMGGGGMQRCSGFVSNKSRAPANVVRRWAHGSRGSPGSAARQAACARSRSGSRSSCTVACGPPPPGAWCGACVSIRSSDAALTHFGSTSATFRRCCGKGTTPCGLNTCCTDKYETCVDRGGGFKECVLKKGAARPCGRSKQPCRPDQCTADGACCSGADLSCGSATCCDPGSGQCFPKANQGQGLCCKPGQEPVFSPSLNASICCAPGTVVCGKSCCEAGRRCACLGERRCRADKHLPDATVCFAARRRVETAAQERAPRQSWHGHDPARARRCDARGALPVCMAEGASPCGQEAQCWAPNNDVCWPKARGGKGACCPKDQPACGDSYCCDKGDTCVVTKESPLGTCCRPGQKPCGGECCGVGTACLNGTCVAQPTCLSGQTACGRMCCQGNQHCCGGGCCDSKFKCTIARDATTGQEYGMCEALECAAGREACGGKCCAAGQLCSGDGHKCCSPSDLACLFPSSAAQVACHTDSRNPRAWNCSLWSESCWLSRFVPSLIPLCCPDGKAPCSPVSNQCCEGQPDREPQVCDQSMSACCPDGSIPCGGPRVCCTPDEYCMTWPFATARCVPRSVPPCGRTTCPAGHTCYSSARGGQGLCCPPGKVVCRGVDTSDAFSMPPMGSTGEVDWWNCCDPPGKVS